MPPILALIKGPFDAEGGVIFEAKIRFLNGANATIKHQRTQQTFPETLRRGEAGVEPLNNYTCILNAYLHTYVK